MDYKEIKQELEPDLQRVRMTIQDALNTDISILNQTNMAILSHSGKLVRPVLALLVAKACNNGKLTEDTIKFAAAAELIHNATLLHDDVADNSNSRRGVPTTMSILGGRASVLLGDFWLVKAVDKILQADKRKIDVIQIFSNTLCDLAEGEMLQLQKSTSCDTREADYIKIIYNKTASLFVSAAYSAAISVCASDEKQEAATKFATHLGLAFQIKDDILDYNGGVEIGKPLGQDLHEQKITMPLLGAFENVSIEEEQAIRKRIIEINGDKDIVEDIVKFVAENGGIDYAESKLLNEVEQANASLSVFGENQYSKLLVDLANFVIGRNN